MRDWREKPKIVKFVDKKLLNSKRKQRTKTIKSINEKFSTSIGKLKKKIKRLLNVKIKKTKTNLILQLLKK